MISKDKESAHGCYVRKGFYARDLEEKFPAGVDVFTE